MLKIFSTSQIRAADRFTIENEPILSIDLMERAANTCVDQIFSGPGVEKGSFLIICGPGNNGGDGLAIARLLNEKDQKVTVAIPNDMVRFSADFRVNYDRLLKTNVTVKSHEQLSDDDFAPEITIIDALFGSGLDRPLEGIYRDLVLKLNTSNSPVIAIDIPSGLNADGITERNAVAVKATLTLSFQFPKLAFLLAENQDYTGELRILPIGLHPEFIEREPVKYFLLEADDIASTIIPRHRFAHKGDFGHALLIGGSKGKIGAVAIMGKACLRAGAGLATVHLPTCGYTAIQASVPELMVSVDDNELICKSLPLLDAYNAIACGPGLGKNPDSAAMLKLLIQEARVPLVLDADALNLLSENPTWLGFLKPGTILTPHPGEFARLAGKSADSLERIKLLQEFCHKYNVYTVLKGAHTIICSPSGNCFFNNTGNAGMATAGSGDVLTGIITGLLSQGYKPIDACLAGVWLHGSAGDIAAAERGEESLIAGDVIENLGMAFRKTRNLI